MIYLFFKMMIPRAMLAMREPWEKKKKKEWKNKPGGQQARIPQIGMLIPKGHCKLSGTDAKTPKKCQL